MVSFKLKTMMPEDEFLALPWDLPLADWPEETTVILPVGTHRNVVRFVPLGRDFVALKELPHRLAVREFEVLSTMRERSLPAVTLIGIASNREDRSGAPLPSLLLTRHLRYSLPYSHLFATRTIPTLCENLVDALALLLARLHLDGVFWGDCSLNNVLFRRDAGALRAYVVDTETAEIHESLTDGQRNLDLQIAVENTIGGLLDLVAAGQLRDEIDPFLTGDEVAARYHALWDDLTQTEGVSTAQLASIHQRLARLNELGFDTDELELDTRDGILRFRPTIIEEGHHKRRLAHLTGIDAHENQARHLLSALRGYGAWLQGGDSALPEAVVAARWLTERWTPALERVPDELRGRLEDPELYHEILQHGWKLSSDAGGDVPLPEAVDSYVRDVLRHHTDERSLITPPEPPSVQ